MWFAANLIPNNPIVYRILILKFDILLGSGLGYKDVSARPMPTMYGCTLASTGTTVTRCTRALPIDFPGRAWHLDGLPSVPNLGGSARLKSLAISKPLGSLPKFEVDFFRSWLGAFITRMICKYSSYI